MNELRWETKHGEMARASKNYDKGKIINVTKTESKTNLQKQRVVIKGPEN